MYSRRTSDVTGLPVLKTDRVPHLIEELKSYVSPGCVIDGEIVKAGSSISSDVTSIMGSSAEEAVAKQEEQGKLLFAAFDILAINGNDISGFMQLDERIRTLETTFETLGSFKEQYIYTVPILRNATYEEKVSNLQSIWDRGGEGAILKLKSATYQQGKRNKTWVKVKESLEFDCVVTGFTDAREITEKVDGTISEAKYKGQVGAVTYGQYNSKGQLVEIGQTSGFPDSVRQDMTENPKKYLGKVLVIQATQQLISGKFRHPRTKGLIRNDKDPKDCIILGDLGG